MMSPSTSAGFRDEILRRMDERNDKMRPYERMFESYCHLADALRKAKTGRPRTLSQSASLEMRPEMAEEYQRMKDELAEIHKKMNMNAMEYMDAKRSVREIKDKLSKVTEERDALKGGQQKFKTRIAELEQALKKATEDMNLVRDEKVSLSLAHMKQTETIQKLEMEQMHFINTVRDLQEKLATVMNAEVEQQTARQQAKVAALIASALTDTSRDERANSLLSQCEGQTGQVNYGDMLPTHAQFKFEASDSELLDVCWLNPDQFATAGQDKKIRIWRVDPNGRQSKISTLTGFGNSVTRMDYDSELKHLLASSNDSSVRVFNVDNQRLLTTLRNHTEKVIVAKFHSSSQAVSGGNDRSIKLWDLKAERCVKSYFPGSTIHDLIGRVSFGGNAWISGHYDKKIRVYDGRAEQPVQTLEMAGKVTSLDIATDGHSILCSTRDDTLSLLDIRNLGTLHIYSAEQYRTSSDFSRCIISPGMDYVAAGSSDGHVYIWNLNSTKLEKVLGRGGHEHPALAVRWNPCGRGLLSCDKLKHVVLWS